MPTFMRIKSRVRRMNTRDKYRKLLMGLATLLLLVLLTGLFALTWYRGYAYTEAMEGAFYQRGHYAVIALFHLQLYLLLHLLFATLLLVQRQTSFMS